MAQESRKDDKKILIDILNSIEKRLHQIVFEQTSPEPGKSKFRKEFIPMLPGPWEEVAAHFQRSREMIERDQFKWEYLDNVGLTREPLEWKKGFLNETVKERTVSRFFKVAKSILGSLLDAIPYVEFIIEFMDLVEAAMKYGRG